MGLYYDLFRFPDNTYLILLSSTTNPSVESAISIANFRGITKALLSEYTLAAKGIFKPIAFVEKLNNLICQDPLSEKFAMSFILLDPLQDIVSYVNCGFGNLLHIPQGQAKPRKLSSDNDLLGVSTSPEFSETVDNWNAGDLLIMHTLVLPQDGGAVAPEGAGQIEGVLGEAITENLLLSSQRQSEAILKKVTSSPVISLVSYPKALICIQRII